MMRAGCWLVVYFCLWVPSLTAARVEFITVLNGERLAGSEICFFPGAAAAKSPASLFLASDNVRCVSADDVLDMPPGAWNFYGRNAGLVSAHAGVFTQRGRGDSGRYQSVRVDLRPAGTISFENLPPTTDRFVAYVPMLQTDTYAPAVLPLPASEKRIIVPADEPVVLLRIRDGKPIAAGKLVTVQAGQTIDALEVTPKSGQSEVLGWIRVDDPALHAINTAGPPTITLIDGQGGRHEPLYQFRNAASAHESFFIFQRVRTGTFEIRLTGTDWRTSAVRATLKREDAGLFLDGPLVARLPQRVTVRWVMPHGFPVQRLACDDEKKAGVGEWSVRLLSCPTWDPKKDHLPRDFTGCRTESSIVLDRHDTGLVAFDLMSAGRYVAALQTETKQTFAAPAVVAPGDDLDVEIPLRLPAVFGKVTEGDRPVRALVKFETGSALTDEDGRYHAVLEGDPLANVIEILPCDGSGRYDHIPAETISGTRQYDIEIPANKIEVSVVDGASGKHIPRASVGRGMFLTAEDAAAAETRDDEITDETGRVVLRRFEPGYFLRICARADGYPRGTCADPVALRVNTDAKIQLKLWSQDMRRGRVAAAAPFVAGILYRAMSNGLIVERIKLDGDGSFVYRGDLAAEVIVVAAVNQPLFVTTHPRLTDEDLLIAVPAGVSRGFTVEISQNLPIRSAWFTVAIGDAVLPVEALAAHLTRMGLTGRVDDGGPARVTGILGSAPVRVIAFLGPYPDAASVEDLFLQPRFASLRASRFVPADGRVVFDRD